MIVKGRKVREYLEKTKHKDHNIAMHEQTSTNEIGSVLEDLYNRGDDIYKMTMKEWVTKIPEYFAGGGRVAYGEGTGGISNFFKNKLKNLKLEGSNKNVFELMEQEGDLMRMLWETLSPKEKRKLFESFSDFKGVPRSLPERHAEMQKFNELYQHELANKPEGFASGGVSNLFRSR